MRDVPISAFYHLLAHGKHGRRLRPHAGHPRYACARVCSLEFFKKKERKRTTQGRDGEDGTPPPHRDFKERGVVH